MESGLGRKVLLVVVMVVGTSLLVWAGVHNARERRIDQQKAEMPKAVLIPEKDGGKAPAAGEESLTPKLEGKAAPAFTLTTLDGKKVSLADYKGHPVFVNFWATWCEPCKLEMPWLEEFSKKYADQGLIVLGLSTDDESLPKSTIAGVAKKLGVTYPILLASDKVKDAYDIEYDPESFYVDKTGTVVIATAGINDGQGGKDAIEANIKKLIASGGK